jgi:hypothetical protein
MIHMGVLSGTNQLMYMPEKRLQSSWPLRADATLQTEFNQHRDPFSDEPAEPNTGSCIKSPEEVFVPS